jgi:hypothetical protein
MVMASLVARTFYLCLEVESMANNSSEFSMGGSVGGNLSNVQGDYNRAVQGDKNQAILGDRNQVTQQNQVGADATTALTKDDIVKLLIELETLIQKSEIPEKSKEEATENLSDAKKAITKEEPKKNIALANLVRVSASQTLLAVGF